MVLEYASGGSLNEKIKFGYGQLSKQLVKRYFRDICEAVRYFPSHKGTCTKTTTCTETSNQKTSSSPRTTTPSSATLASPPSSNTAPHSAALLSTWRQK